MASVEEELRKIRIMRFVSLLRTQGKAKGKANACAVAETKRQSQNFIEVKQQCFTLSTSV